VIAASIVRTVIAVRSLKGEKVAPSGIGRLIMNRMGCASIGQRFVPVVPLTHASLLAIALAHVSSQRLNTEDPRRDFFDKKNADIGDICAAWMTEQVRFTSNARLIRQLDLQAAPETNQRVAIAQAYYRLTGGVSARR
jgi:hypothetical protein